MSFCTFGGCWENSTRSSGERVAVVCGGVALAAGDGVALAPGEGDGDGLRSGSGSGGSEDSSMPDFGVAFGFADALEAAELFFFEPDEEPPLDFFFVAASSGTQTRQINNVQISQRIVFVFTSFSRWVVHMK